ncbi:MAG: hypothetical protein ACOCU4_07425, partial [Alkalispirochaeta sp.]
MSSEHHFKTLYRILVEAEGLLSGASSRSPSSESEGWADLSYEARVSSMSERGWDLGEDASAQPGTAAQPGR